MSEGHGALDALQKLPQRRGIVLDLHEAVAKRYRIARELGRGGMGIDPEGYLSRTAPFLSPEQKRGQLQLPLDLRVFANRLRDHAESTDASPALALLAMIALAGAIRAGDALPATIAGGILFLMVGEPENQHKCPQNAPWVS